MLLPAVFAATFRILRRPAFLVPALLVALAADGLIQLNGWPRPGFEGWPVERQVTTAFLVSLARAWLSVTIIAVGIAVMRGKRPGLLRQWVHVLTALKIGAVSLLLFAGVLLGTLVFVVPGVYLLLRWSQVLPAMIEGRTRVNDVLMYSEAIASAHYLRILLIWFVAWAVPALLAFGIGYADRALESAAVPYLRHVESVCRWMWPAVLQSAGLALIAALYVELDTRAYAPVRHQ